MIVACTANWIESEEEENEYKQAGFDSIMAKPIPENEFAKVIEKAILQTKKRHSSKKI